LEAEEFECGLACGLTCRRQASVSDATAMTMANNEPATPSVKPGCGSQEGSA